MRSAIARVRESVKRSEGVDGQISLDASPVERKQLSTVLDMDSAKPFSVLSYRGSATRMRSMPIKDGSAIKLELSGLWIWNAIPTRL